MRILRPAVLFLAIASAASFGATAQAPAGDLHAFVREETPKELKAYRTKDVQFFDQLFDPSFKSKDGRGVVLGRKESLFMIRYRFNTLQSLTVSASKPSVQQQGPDGSASATYTLVGLTLPRHGRPTQQVKIVESLRDHYKKVGGQWRLVYRETTKAPLIDLKPAGAPARQLTPASPTGTPHHS